MQNEASQDLAALKFLPVTESNLELQKIEQEAL